MAKTIKRNSPMLLVLSAEEMDRLETLANKLGMSKSALVRQWLRDASEPPRMPSPTELKRMLQAWKAAIEAAKSRDG